VTRARPKTGSATYVSHPFGQICVVHPARRSRRMPRLREANGLTSSGRYQTGSHASCTATPLLFQRPRADIGAVSSHHSFGPRRQIGGRGWQWYSISWFVGEGVPAEVAVTKDRKSEFACRVLVVSAREQCPRRSRNCCRLRCRCIQESGPALPDRLITRMIVFGGGEGSGDRTRLVNAFHQAKPVRSSEAAP
jgi:hypothetical protein